MNSYNVGHIIRAQRELPVSRFSPAFWLAISIVSAGAILVIAPIGWAS